MYNYRKHGTNEPTVTESLRRYYGHAKLSKMAAYGFDVTGNSAIRSTDPENPTLEPNMKCIGSPVAEIWSFAYIWGMWNPRFGGREIVDGHRWYHSKERWWFPTDLHCDRCDICNHSAAICN